MNWKRTNVLVTGADGFIGSHLAERLVRLGAKTTALVYYNAFGSKGLIDSSELKDEMEVVAGDICDRASLDRIMQKTDVIFHLAALIGVPYSYEAPESYVRTNILGTLNVLEPSRANNLKRGVITSTSEVYGRAIRVPIDESHPLRGQSPYSASKIGADKLAEAFHLSYGLPVVTVRPFNTFGPRQSARAVIPTIILQCLTGSSVRLGNLTPTRDLNYVDNIVEGYTLAAESPRVLGQTINLGSGREISIGQLAKLIAKMSGTKISIRSDRQRVRPKDSEVERLAADSSLARKFLGWRPRYSLEEGLEITIDWFRNNLDKYRSDEYTL